jgi:hypothetical protein
MRWLLLAIGSWFRIIRPQGVGSRCACTVSWGSFHIVPWWYQKYKGGNSAPVRQLDINKFHQCLYGGQFVHLVREVPTTVDWRTWTFKRLAVHLVVDVVQYWIGLSWFRLSGYWNIHIHVIPERLPPQRWTHHLPQQNLWLHPKTVHPPTPHPSHFTPTLHP